MLPMNNETPILTIFIPAYNAEPYLSETLDSVLSQSFRDFELIIVDDGSSDGTAAIAQNYADRDQRVRFVRSPHRGEVAARNKALTVANPSSRYFLNHDSDDISFPGKLEALVEYLEAHPDIAIAGTLAEYFDDAGTALGGPPLEVVPDRIRKTFHETNSMINSASMIRRAVFETIGGYREEFRSVDDYDFFMRALLSGASLANIPQVLHRIRLHPKSIGSTRSELQQQLATRIRTTYIEFRHSDTPKIVRSPLTLSKAYRPGRSARRLRILHTVQMYYPHVGGSEEVVKQLSERLVRRGHHVTVATGFDPRRDFTTLNGVEVRQFRVLGSSVRGIQGEAEAFQRFVLEGDFDVVVNYAAQIWSTDLVFPLLDRIRGAKILVPCGYSGLFDPVYQRYFETLPGILRKYDRVVHLSDNYRDAEFSRRHGLQNSTVIGNAAGEEEFLPTSASFRAKHGIRTRYLVVTVANHYHGKGHNHLLRWFVQLGRTDVTLAIIGKMTDGGCWNDCVRAGKSIPGVVFFEDLPREEVVAALKEADLFWFGSEIECFPLVILEAMAAGIPWLSMDVGNVAELAGGWVARSEDMVAKAHRLLASEELRKNLGGQGQAEWKARFTWDRIVDRYEQMYLTTSVDRGKTRSVTRDPGSLGSNKEVAKVALRERRTTEPGLVSVVIPCYNQAQYLSDAVGSVLAQTHRNLEVIIVDDGSPDNTREVAQQLISRHPNQRIRLLSHKNQGLAASRNAGIREAVGEFILPLDSDDKLSPTMIQVCVDRMMRDSSVAIVAVDVQEFGDSNKTLSCGNPVLEQIAVENQINYCSLFRRALWEQVGGYRLNMRWGYEDWDFWISCLEKGARAEIVREPLFLYRKRGASMYSSALDHDAELRAQIVLNHPGLYEPATEQWARALFRIESSQSGIIENSEAHQTVATYNATRARWHEALPHLLHVAGLIGASAEMQFLLGAARLKMKDFAGARAAFRSCLDQHPDHTSAQFLSAIASAGLGDLASAAAHAEDAMELDLKLAAAYELRIAVCRAQGDLVGAADLLSRCRDLQIRPAAWALSDHVPSLSSPEEWAEFLYSKYLEFSPLPLLVVNSKRTERKSVGPRVSVILPTFNRPERLAQAIDSVLAQTMQDFEVIVVNDGGAEAEAVVLQRNTSGKITYVRHGANKGLAAARNTGIGMARGEYVTYLDDDDLYYPDHLHTLVRCLDTNECDVAYTDANRAHQVQQGKQFVVTHRDRPFSVDFNHDQILIGNFIPVLCVMHRKSCLEQAGLFDEALTTHEDWDLWIRLSRKYRFGHIRKTTCEFSWRTDGTSMTSGSQKDFLRTVEMIYSKTEDYVRGKPQLVAARNRYLEEKRLTLKRETHDTTASRSHVSQG